MKLSSRDILIAGAAPDIGTAASELLAHEGAQVAHLDCDSAPPFAAACTVVGASAHVRAGAEPGSVCNVVADAAAAMGGVDDDVSAAGIDLIRDFETFAEWQPILAVNVTVTKSPTAALSANGSVCAANLVSGAGVFPIASRTACCASKAAVVMFSKELAIYVSPRNIRENVICPGSIEPSMPRAGSECVIRPDRRARGCADPLRAKARWSRRVRRRRRQILPYRIGFDVCNGLTLVVDGDRFFALRAAD